MFNTSTLRDMRRTYQRAFKAVLFSGKLELNRRGAARIISPSSATCSPIRSISPDTPIIARARPRSRSIWSVFDFNFLPIEDNYHQPTADGRTAPSLHQSQGMFDWWERLYDYTVVRRKLHRRCKAAIWQSFQEAKLNPRAIPAICSARWCGGQVLGFLDLRYYQDQSSMIYSVSDADLEDDRWLVRVWHADRWIRYVMDRFHAKDISRVRPDLWASDDPSAPVPASAVTQTGNAQSHWRVRRCCMLRRASAPICRREATQQRASRTRPQGAGLLSVQPEPRAAAVVFLEPMQPSPRI